MLAFHSRFAWVVVVLNIAVGLWGIGMAVRNRPAPRPFWIALLAGQAATALQVTIGVIMFQTRKPPGLHVFYGFVVLFAAVLVWAFRNDNQRRWLATVSGVALFIGSVSIRAVLKA